MIREAFAPASWRGAGDMKSGALRLISARTWRVGLVLALAGACAAWPTQSAQAAFPGSNGKLTFSRGGYFRNAATAIDIAAIRPDGADLKTLIGEQGVAVAELDGAGDAGLGARRRGVACGASGSCWRGRCRVRRPAKAYPPRWLA